MNIKNKFLQISITAFALSLVQTIVLSLQMYLMSSLSPFDSPSNFMLINYIGNLANLIIIPLLIFTVFYLISKRSDSPLELRPTVMALLVGNIASLLAGSIIYSGIVIESNVEVILGSMLQFLMSFLAENSLEALAGLFVGYVIRNKLTLSARASF